MEYENSWETLQKTADVSDDELNSRYQGTALYLTLCTVLERDNGPIIQPSEALMIPSTEEIVSRWPGMSPEQVDALIRDYNTEQDRLGELELEDIFLRVHELAVNGVEEDA
jgi:nuclear pore complex protein Nup133